MFVVRHADDHIRTQRLAFCAVHHHLAVVLDTFPQSRRLQHFLQDELAPVALLLHVTFQCLREVGGVFGERAVEFDELLEFGLQRGFFAGLLTEGVIHLLAKILQPLAQWQQHIANLLAALLRQIFLPLVQHTVGNVLKLRGQAFLHLVYLLLVLLLLGLCLAELFVQQLLQVAFVGFGSRQIGGECGHLVTQGSRIRHTLIVQGTRLLPLLAHHQPNDQRTQSNACRQEDEW